ncbi:MAG: 4-hydroxyphenylpyruvate dioxygenase [Lacunisphaera sp.]|jgi:4-hydroxyphenylpyruvate dioxygenase|nr:4-hydroxyphenylpyruvate dioxygenase [Lacunisphaera sp.]
MSTTYFDTPTDKKTVSNPLGLKGVDHIEFIVDNADQWRDFFVNKYGMTVRAYGDNASGLKGRRAFVVGQGRVNFLVAEPQGKGAEADFMQWHLEKHGCGVRDVAFKVKDAKAAYTEAQRRGAKSARGIFEDTGIAHAAIAAYGDTIHSFVERRTHGEFAPGYVNQPGGIEDRDINFAMIDHVVANVEQMDPWVQYYQEVFGFDLFMHFDINTGRSALMSKVVSSTDGWIKMPINEPSSANSQIQEFLDQYQGPGVQHIALLTPDIVSTIGEMRRMGQDFLEVPDTYYDASFDARVGAITEDKEVLKSLRILADRDEGDDGYLLQLFTKCVFARPTLFFEVIQRRGRARGFGEGNFRALFEAIEREQAKRGTL